MKNADFDLLTRSTKAEGLTPATHLNIRFNAKSEKFSIFEKENPRVEHAIYMKKNSDAYLMCVVN